MCDGDILLVVEDKDFIKLAEKNMKNIVPLYYEMKKADAAPLDSEHINNGIMLAYKSGKIGIYSNNITKIWNYKKFTDEYIDIVKLLCAESNFSIDSAKTLYMPKRPEWFRRKMIKFQKENLSVTTLLPDLPAKYVIPQDQTTKNSNRSLRIIIYRVLFRISMLSLTKVKILAVKQ